MFEYESWENTAEEDLREIEESSDDDVLTEEDLTEQEDSRPTTSVERYFKEMARGGVLSQPPRRTSSLPKLRWPRITSSTPGASPRVV